MVKYLLTVLLLLGATVLMAAPSVQAYVDENTVAPGYSIMLTLEISGDNPGSAQVDMPNVKGFTVRQSGSMMSSNMSFVNGRMQSNTTQTYTYSLINTQEGSYVIPPISVKIDGKTLTTTPINIKVSAKAAKSSPAPTGHGYNNQMRRERATSQAAPEDRLYLATETEKKPNYYIGDPITVTYTLYTQYDMNLTLREAPDYDGFWKEILYEAKKANWERRVIDGRAYRALELQKISLTPRRSGKLTIPGLTVDGEIVYQASFFAGLGSRKSVVIEGKTVPLTVKDIPNPKPAAWQGAIGNLSVKAEISKDELKAGDSFTYTLTIQGRGNIQFIDAPELPANPHFRLSDPEVETVMQKDNAPGQGRRIFRWLVIPLDAGEFSLDPFTFSWFEPKSGKFCQNHTPAFKVNVAPGTMVSSGPLPTAQADVILQGQDIEYVPTGTNLPGYTFIINQSWYWLLVALFAILPLAMYLARLRRQKLEGNQQFMRRRLADKVLRRYLKQAKEFAGANDQQFYAAAQTGLANYVADLTGQRRGLPVAQLIDAMQKHSGSQQLAQQFAGFMQRCDQARFAPGGADTQAVQKDFEQLQQLIEAIGRQRGAK